jgi:hypothetical protein
MTATPLTDGHVPGVPGDVPALGRLIATEGSAQSRRFLEWGLQQRYYQGLGLQIDSGSLVTSGFGGSSTTGSGSYNTNVDRATLTTTPTAVVGTGNLGHIGTFRVKAHVYASSTDVQVRLSWQDGSGVFRANDYATPPVSGTWAEIDLGVITVTAALAGTQQWSGRVEAYSDTAGDTVDVDYLQLIPAGEGYGKARAAYSYAPGAVFGYDQFTSTTAGNNLNARVAPAGGTWATSGDAVDLQFADAPGTSETVTRSVQGDVGTGRVALLGSTTYTDMEVGVDFRHTLLVSADSRMIGRWTDSSNYAYLTTGGVGQTFTDLQLVVRVGASNTSYLLDEWGQLAEATWYRLRLVIYSTGLAVGQLLDANGGILASGSARDTNLATGGTLASGKLGFADYNSTPSATARYYDNVYAATPATEPIVLYSGRQAQVRYDSAIRQDSGGTVSALTPSYRGARFYVPPAGAEARTSRIALKAHRADIEVNDATNVTDALQEQVALTPRYLVPR